ncbi:MAG TPA: hypothetical protein VLB82_04930 [Thermodesulfobacteriota bacterium]|nr:hypothetical protein [Thermodesulfobacteriota bacterium]
MLYRPSIKLLEEILETEETSYSGFTGFLIWNILATIGAPFTLLVLLKNDNQRLVESMALSLADKAIDDDE